MIAKYFNKGIRFLLRFNFFWKILQPLILFSENLKHQKFWTDRRALDIHIKRNILKSPIVSNGYFKSMVYPDFLAAGSAIYPKFIGSYERELTPVFEQIIKEKYDLIIDVGCAEGYYAVGLAMLMPDATVIAYDTDPRARDLCKQIAILNNVSERVKIEGTLTANELGKIDFTDKKSLIISDCEGFEKELFTKNNIQNLKNCDLLIETHDLFDLDISAYLIKLFKETHQTPIVIASLDDIKKAQTYEYPETKNLDLNMKKVIFGENRKAIMEWLFFKCK